MYLQVTMSLERFLGDGEGEEFIMKTYLHVLEVCQELLIEYTNESRYDFI